MESHALCTKFLDFFKAHGHAVVPSSSLLPDDPSVLLTTAGMQQFKKYFTGEADPMKDFGNKNTASIQKSFRTSDIDEVGDESHLTFFEMLGNFSFGGYGKREAIEYAHEFLTKELGLSIEYVTVFGGDTSENSVPIDEESEKIWRDLGVTRVEKRGREDNCWGPTGNEGPCGPTTEIFINDVEVWNLVFNEYYCRPDRSLEKLKTLGIDTGLGLERLAMVAQDKANIFETDLFAPFIAFLPAELEERKKRVIVDHLRGSAFLLADGVRPSNKEAGYILRRLLRRIFAYEHINGLSPQIFESIILALLKTYGAFYPELMQEKNLVINEYWKEWERFSAALARGLKELERAEEIDASVAFRLYESFGLPYEVIKEQGGARASLLTREAFDEEFKKHQAQSKIGQEKKFGGHGLILNTGELKASTDEEVRIVTRLHTATHLLQAALRAVLGPEVEQRGSDITAERTRFDFSYPKKLTHRERQSVEDWVNDKIKRDLPMIHEEMGYDEAIASGALHFFKEKYPERVNVYSVVDPKTGEVISRELCGGPHVARTGEIGAFRITKEESIASGTRRIRAVVE